MTPEEGTITYERIAIPDDPAQRKAMQMTLPKVWGWYRTGDTIEGMVMRYEPDPISAGPISAGRGRPSFSDGAPLKNCGYLKMQVQDGRVWIVHLNNETLAQHVQAARPFTGQQLKIVLEKGRPGYPHEMEFGVFVEKFHDPEAEETP